MNPVLSKGYAASVEVKPRRIIKFVGGAVCAAAASTDKAIGVSQGPVIPAGQHVDVVRSGIPEILLGGTVAVGDELTSNADGRGIKLVGAGESVGRADSAGVADDIIDVYVRPLTVQA